MSHRVFPPMPSPDPPPSEVVILVVRQNDGPSEMLCRGRGGRGCGLLMIPDVLKRELRDPDGRVYHTDFWRCWACDRVIEVRYAEWVEREGRL